MKITVAKTEGMTGSPEELGPIESDDLSENLRAEIDDELGGVDFFEMPAEPEGKRIADVDGYRITIVDGDRSHSVQFDQVHNRGLGHLLRLIEKSGVGYHPRPLDVEP
jgi:hypothetical protein